MKLHAAYGRRLLLFYARNLELENALLKVQLWEHNGFIQLPNEIAEAVDQALLPKPKKKGIDND